MCEARSLRKGQGRIERWKIDSRLGRWGFSAGILKLSERLRCRLGSAGDGIGSWRSRDKWRQNRRYRNAGICSPARNPRGWNLQGSTRLVTHMARPNHNQSADGHQHEETQPKTRDGPKRLFTLNEAGAYIGLSHWRVRSLIYSGQLAYIRLGRRVLVDLEDL